MLLNLIHNITKHIQHSYLSITKLWDIHQFESNYALKKAIRTTIEAILKSQVYQAVNMCQKIDMRKIYHQPKGMIWSKA